MMQLLPGIPPDKQKYVLAAGAGVLALAYYKKKHPSSATADTSQALYQPPDQGPGGAGSSGDAAALLQLDSDFTRLSASEINLLNALNAQLKAQHPQATLTPAELAAIRWSAGVYASRNQQPPAAPRNASPAPSRTPAIASASSAPRTPKVSDLSPGQLAYFTAWTRAIKLAQSPAKNPYQGAPGGPHVPSAPARSAPPILPRRSRSGATSFAGGRRTF